MDENNAWKQFERTGKIEDYINYINIKGQPTGQEYGNIPRVVNLRDLDAGKNRRTDY